MIANFRAASMHQIRKSMSLTLDILFNKNDQVGEKDHTAFIKNQGENVAFLLSRITVLIAETYDASKAALDYLEVNQHHIDQTSAGLWLTKCALGVKCENATRSGYPDEFPHVVLEMPFAPATKTFVWHALCVWSYYYKDQSKLAEVVNVGIERILQVIKAEKHNLKFVKSERKLQVRSAEWFYYFSHVVLIATMWGELKTPVGGSKILWAQFGFMLLEWGKRLRPNARANIEVWIELLLCLRLLNNHDEVDRLQKEHLFDMDVPFVNQLQFYHTYVLWGIFYAVRLKYLKDRHQSQEKSTS